MFADATNPPLEDLVDQATGTVHARIKRRADAVGNSPTTTRSRLVGSVLSEQHEGWQVTDRRYLGEESLAHIKTMRQLENGKKVTSNPPPGKPDGIAERFTYVHKIAGRDHTKIAMTPGTSTKAQPVRLMQM